MANQGSAACATEHVELTKAQAHTEVVPRADSGTAAQGCQKVDFLFVVDNSASMHEEQENLVRSFPGFIEAVERSSSIRDYHIMVVDTDASATEGSLSLVDGNITCSGASVCCYVACGLSLLPGAEITSCNGVSCAEVLTTAPDYCEDELGVGKILGADGQSCGVEDPQRYMTHGQPELAETFACSAQVGTLGAEDEQSMAAMAMALSMLNNGAGGCNEGFLRDDALLVVTLITDEDDENSPGNPALWREIALEAKNGEETAVVVLGLLADGNVSGGLAGGPCTEQNTSAPLLQEFVQSFHFGAMGSVCAADYAPFFEVAVTKLQTACSQFKPAR